MRRLRVPSAGAAKADAGSALMLVPAGVLVLVLLGALAVDSAVVVLAQRDLQNRTAAVANDVVTVALDDARYYDAGDLTLSPEAVTTYTRTSFSDANRPDGYEAWGATAQPRGRQVEVRAWAEVSSIFFRAVPGLADVTRVEARSVATARTP